MKGIAAVVLDRDGTLIEDRNYIRHADDVVFYPGTFRALRAIHEKGYPIFIASNQSGVGRGLISKVEFESVHQRFVESLKQNSAPFDEVHYCFHTPDEDCECRKPKKGLVPTHFGEHSIDWSNSYVVGDQMTDLDLGRTLGAKSVLVLTGKGKTTILLPSADGAEVYENIEYFSKALEPLRTA